MRLCTDVAIRYESSSLSTAVKRRPQRLSDVDMTSSEPQVSKNYETASTDVLHDFVSEFPADSEMVL